MNIQSATLKTVLMTCLLSSTPLESCTLVFWNTNGISPMVGRTMDLYRDDQPQLVVYPRGMEREGLVEQNPIKWTSKYGSVVITALHTSSATEGLNEAGLSASLLYLENTEYETRQNEKPGLSVGLWAQYMLDNYKTVSDALAGMSTFQVVPMPIGGRTWPIHMTIQDKTGDMAVIEYVQGQIQIHHGPQYKVVSNDPPYAEQLSNLKRYKIFKGMLPMPGDIDSVSRFVRASSYLKTLPQPKDETQAAMLLLGVVRTVMVPEGAEDTSASELSDTWPTRWLSIKDLKHQVFYMQSTKSPNLIWVDLHTLKFKKGSPILYLNPKKIELTGNIEEHLKEQNLLYAP